jgi:hypothetical protein
MGSELQPLAERLGVFQAHLESLAHAARERLGTDGGYRDSEWYGLLTNKLLPQLVDEPFLVVSIVGGTNTGKTTIFNHLAGEMIGEANPQAGFTRFPICLTPPGFDQRRKLQQVFPAFDVAPLPEGGRVQQERSTLAGEQASLDRTHDSENLLYHTTGSHLPANLLLLDTPDIDAIAENLRRATMICQASDLLVAVLTDQKYNDAAGKVFFREAVRQKKSVVIVFSKHDWPDTEEIWRTWLATFHKETGVSPLAVYVVPRDATREKSQLKSLGLSFIPVESELAGAGETGASEAVVGRDVAVENTTAGRNPLLAMLTELHFAELKLRATRGAIDQLVLGSSQWLEGLRRKSETLRHLATALEGSLGRERLNWPAAPRPLVVETLWKIWNTERAPIAQNIHWAYGKLGQALLAPVGWMRGKSGQAPLTPIEKFREDEWNSISQVVDHLFGELERATPHHSDLREAHEFTPRLQAMLSGQGREKVLEELKQAHLRCDLAGEVNSLVERDFRDFLARQPGLKLTLQILDQAAAFSRVGVSVVLAFALPGFELATQGLGQGLLQSTIHLTSETVVGVAGAGATDVAASYGAGQGLGQFQQWLLRVDEQFVAGRIRWFEAALAKTGLGKFVGTIGDGARLAEVDSWKALQQTIHQIDLMSRK